MSEAKSIVDIVNGSPTLLRTIEELKKNAFIVDGIFHPKAYLRDTERIRRAWGKKKSRTNAIAMGVSLYNDWFQEMHKSIVESRREPQLSRIGDPKASRETMRALKRWQKDVARVFPSEHEEIDDTCRTLGQYMEYMNRKSQGF